MGKLEVYKKRNKDNGNGTNLDIRFSVCSDNPQDLDPLPDLRMHYLRCCPPDWATGKVRFGNYQRFHLYFLYILFFGLKYHVFGLFLD